MNREEHVEWQDAIRECELPDRTWFILERRFGPGKRLTLQNVGDVLGISRERVRQLQWQGLGVLKQDTVRLGPSLGLVEDAFAANEVRGSEIGLRTRKGFITTVQRVSASEVCEHDIRRLLLILRVLGSLGVAESMWPRMSFCACVLPRAIEEHVGVREHLLSSAGKKSARRQRSTYRSMAERILRREGVPLHWTEITERCEASKERESFSQSSCFNAIQSDTKLFVRVGPGTYALAAWGVRKGKHLTDLIGAVFREEGRCLEYADVLHRILGKQTVKAESVELTLKMNPRFYCATSGKYGLRAWLPPREEQTLRTPKDLVETADSVRRVARARARGYDVEGIVGRDRMRDGQ